MKAKPIIVAALACLCSCTVNNHGEEPTNNVRICLIDGYDATKLTATDGESTVNNAKIIIFNEDGNYISSQEASGGTIDTKLFNGSYTIAAVANHTGTSLEESASLLALEEKAISLADNRNGSLVMFGKTSITIDDENASVSLPVARLVAKISVKEIANEITDPLHRSLPFTINRIFLSNVPGTAALDGTSDLSTWYNKNGVWESEDSNIKDLVEDSEINANVANGSTYKQIHSYYTFANNTGSDSFDKEWSPRYTRLVIEATIGQDICYYNIPVAGIEANHTYTINKLTITKKGTDNPWDKCDSETFGASISVTDWEEGLSTDKTI